MDKKVAHAIDKLEVKELKQADHVGDDNIVANGVKDVVEYVEDGRGERHYHLDEHNDGKKEVKKDARHVAEANAVVPVRRHEHTADGFQVWAADRDTENARAVKLPMQVGKLSDLLAIVVDSNGVEKGRKNKAVVHSKPVYVVFLKVKRREKDCGEYAKLDICRTSEIPECKDTKDVD